MSWRHSGQQSDAYYYQSVREGDRVRRVYLGRGPAAEQAARQVEERRELARASREADQQESARTANADRILSELHDFVQIMMRATLLVAGCHDHKGQWRRRRTCPEQLR